MTSEEMIQVAKNGYANFGRGDIAAILETCDENIEWITPDLGVPGGGISRGRAGVAQFFQQIGDTWTFQAFEPKNYIAGGNQVVAQGSYTATSKATGKQASADWAMVWTFGANGKLVQFQEYTDTATLRDAVTAASAA